MRVIQTAIVGIIIALPLVAQAFPFGGRASIVLRCVYNSTIYTNLGPPRGGEYIWTTATRTYQFGPPAYAGQWILGLAGAPYYCIYKISPLTIYTGIAITMMGSSGGAAPSAPPTKGPSLALPGPYTPTPKPSPVPPPSPSGKVLISEVYHAVDTTHGVKPTNEWIEIFNGGATALNIGGWKIEDASTGDTIPVGTSIEPGGFLVVAATSTTRELWNIPSTKFVSLGSAIGDGLSNGGDRVIVRNASGSVVDALSWGSNTTIMNPSVTPASYADSLSRTSLLNDTDTSNDWASRPPSPGK